MNRDPSRNQSTNPLSRRAFAAISGSLLVLGSLAGCDLGKSRAGSPPAPITVPGASGGTKAESNYRTAPVKTDDNICYMAEGQQPIIGVDNLDYVDGVPTNSGDFNGPWAVIPLGQASQEVQDACADVAERGVIYTAKSNIVINP